MRVQRFFVLSFCVLAVIANFIGISECLGTIITPVSATASSTFAGYTPADNTRNGSGLGVGAPWQPDTSSTNTNQWLSGGGIAGETIEWDLGAVYSLSGFHMWNANEGYNGGAPGNVARGIQVADVKVSTNGISYADLGNMTFLTATGLDTYTGDDYTLATTAQFVKFTVVSTFDNAGFVGVSEIRFISPVPEPNSLILFCLGSVGLLRIVRRRRQK